MRAIDCTRRPGPGTCPGRTPLYVGGRLMVERLNHSKGHLMPQRIIVITGASDGIGAAAARYLARAGEQIVVVGRSPGKTAAVGAELGVDYFVCDFAQLAQV